MKVKTKIMSEILLNKGKQILFIEFCSPYRGAKWKNLEKKERSALFINGTRMRL